MSSTHQRNGRELRGPALDWAREAETLDQADRLWRQAFVRGWWKRLWQRWRGRDSAMVCLRDDDTTAEGGYYAGLRTVPVAQIQGSEGRCEAFDADLNPLRRHDRLRWVQLCRALLEGVVLPPIALLQVGGRYYVRDGHHRVSVARALGQRSIEAEVIVWG